MLPAVLILHLIATSTSCFRLLESKVRPNLCVSAKTRVGKGVNFSHLSSLHNEAFEHPEFQLHIPPISDSLPQINKNLTSSTVFSSLVDDSIGEKIVNVESGPDSEAEDSQLSDQNEAELTLQDDYIDGPLDVLQMLNSQRIPEYRHPNSRPQPTDKASGKDAKGLEKSELYSWRLERPADVFIFNFATIDLGFREYIYTSCKVLETLPFYQASEEAKALFSQVFRNETPVWLSTCFRYSMPYANSFTDLVLITHFYVRHFLKNSQLLRNSKKMESSASKGDDWVTNLNRLIRNGNPFDLVDFLAEDRYRLRMTGHELQRWREDNTREELLNELSHNDLESAFMSERRKLKGDNKFYCELVRYRSGKHLSFNKTAVELINYYTHYLKMPIYIATDLEGLDEAEARLKLFGVKLNELLSVFKMDPKGNLLDPLLSSLSLNPLIPIHYFDNSINNLNAILHASRFDKVRFYFVDWGRSSYDDKLSALYTDRVKYVKRTAWLVEFVCKFSSSLSREWTHGYRLRYPDEEERAFLLDWKARWHKPVNVTSSLNSRILPNL